MTRFTLAWIAILIATQTGFLTAQTAAQKQPLPERKPANIQTIIQSATTRQRAEGEALAADLRSAHPTEDTEIPGTLIIKRRGQRSEEIPVLSRIFAGKEKWTQTYETAPSANRGAERLVVVRGPDCINEYLHARAPTPAAPVPEPQPLSAHQAQIPFAGSDFWLTDLGLDFLHWPIQIRTHGEMRLSQATHVLESIREDASGVVRVKSWIDKDTGGILIAEGYNRANELVKQFSLSGSSFKKVDGRWHLQQMKITSPKLDSQTILKFDLRSAAAESSGR